jgi:thiol-disulfide isomerase/thioredoxin
MNRRECLGSLAAAIGAAACGAGYASAIGDPVAWTDITLLDGRVLPATTVAGRVVVVETWASWCPFCARQNPHFQALYAARAGRGLEFMTFSIDRDPDKARAYMAEHRYTFPAAMATAQSEKWFGPRRGLPEVHVVDRQGRIVFIEAQEMFPEDVRALARFSAT